MRWRFRCAWLHDPSAVHEIPRIFRICTGRNGSCWAWTYLRQSPTCGRPSVAADLTITVAAATRSARTELAAFDRALVSVGAENRNLIRLSSVIPTASTIVAAPTRDGGEWGDRLYVVYAEQRASVPGAAAWAGVGWAQDDRTGAGLFVEHEGDAEDEGSRVDHDQP